MRYRPPNPHRSGGRALAELAARSLAGCVVSPHMMDLIGITSAMRRWSQICGVKMTRTRPHPRPWDGPIVDFSGFFFGATPEKLAGNWIG